MSPAALDLAEQLLAYDPASRITAAAALDAPYFKQDQPLAERPTGSVTVLSPLHSLDSPFSRLSTLEGEWHELETKVERQKKRKKEGAA